MKEMTEALARVKLLLMDVDGVLTDGKLYNVPDPVTGNMVETKGFDSQDGIALQWLSWHGIKTGLISGRVSPATEERARQCKFSYVYQGHIEKIPILEEIMADCGIEARRGRLYRRRFHRRGRHAACGGGDRDGERARRGKERRAMRDVGVRRLGRCARSGGDDPQGQGALGGDSPQVRSDPLAPMCREASGLVVHVDSGPACCTS